MIDAPLLAGRLDRLMTERSMSLRDLQRASGINKNTIRGWRTGSQTRVVVSKVEQLAAPLSTTVDHLLGVEVSRTAALATEIDRDRIRLLQRVAALEPAIAALEAATPDLMLALTDAERIARSCSQLANLSDRLPEFRHVVDEARRAVESG